MLLVATTATWAATAPYDANALFDWAERTYPQLFPGPQTSVVAPPYVYRHYPQTGNYVGVSDGVVYLLGPVSQGQLQAVGPMAQFECQVLPGNCAATLPRLELVGSVAVVRDSQGRHLAWGEDRYTARTDGTALPGTDMRVLAQGAKQVVVSAYGGFEVKADGRLLAWGTGYWMRGVGVANFAAYSTPVQLKLHGLAAQITDSSVLGIFAMALQTDGSVWQLPGDVQAFPWSPGAIQSPGRVKSLALGSQAYMLLYDGTVWHVNHEGGAPRQVQGVADAQQISCQYSQCAVLRKDGRVLTWAPSTNISTAETAVVVEELSNIRQVAASGFLLAAIDHAGQLWSPSSLRGVTQLRPVPGFSGATDIACSFSTCIALKADGSAWGWGSNSGGVLGRGVISDSGAPPTRIPGVTVP